MRKTLLVLFSAAALGVVGAASVAQANDEYGGFVVPGSMDGVNPVFHPRWFGPAARAKAANSYNAYDHAPQSIQHDRHAR
jgi:ABC-type sugar transport system substrate-binding protein